MDKPHARVALVKKQTQRIYIYGSALWVHIITPLFILCACCYIIVVVLLLSVWFMALYTIAGARILGVHSDCVLYAQLVLQPVFKHRG